MRVTNDCTSRTPTAFSADFLAAIRALRNPSSARAAVLAGPWEAEEMEDKQFAVCRREEPFLQTGRTFGVFRSRAEALGRVAGQGRSGRLSGVAPRRPLPGPGVPCSVPLTPDFEHTLQRFKDLRGLPSKSEAVRVAVREALERETRQPSRADFREWLGLGKRVPLNPQPRFRSHADLWADGR